MTSGGSNPNGEDPHRQYPFGTDADADLSSDNSQIVFSRLRTGFENDPLGHLVEAGWNGISLDGSEEILKDYFL